MRIALFTLIYGAFYVQCAFSNTSSQSQPNDWTGFYTGLVLGAQWGSSNDKTGIIGYNLDNDKWSYNESGFNAGAELGYSYPWHQFLVGPEIELGYLGMSGSGAQPSSPGFDTIGKTSGGFYTTFRARLGVDLEHYLLFATAGAIGVDYTKQVVDNCNIAPCGGALIDAQKNDFSWGYTLGGGIERMFEKSWSAKLECLYFNLNSQSFSGTTNLGTIYDWRSQTSGYILRGGVNYHF